MVSRRRRFDWGARIAIATALAAAVLTAVWARDTQVLQKAKPVRGLLEANVAQRFSLPLAQRACALGTLVPREGTGAKAASKLHLSVIDPATNKPLREFRMDEASDAEFGFCIDAAGTYPLELRAAVGGNFELTLDAVLGRAKVLAPAIAPAPLLMSPRLRTLAAQLEHSAQLEKFWADTQREGTPLIEPSDDPDRSWVTFLYRSAAAHSVSVSWQMWTFALENTALARLPATDLWWKSVRFPNDTRFSYQLVIDPPSAGTR